MPVVDASIVVDWVAPDVDPDGPAGRLLTRLSKAGVALYAPRLLLEEVANALLTGCRRQRWDGAAADEAYQRLRQLPISLVDEAADRDRAWDLSRRYDEHPIYDMLYAAVAERLRDQLFTADARLRRRLAPLDFVVGP
ncbi:MAG: type II toxin-antitoxin system VapC family toxin [Nocardioidaceae bacterium]|nr:type II toxin-antitoxin system VapC family toxin [Nocardioidaceae bacterium]